MLFDVEVEGDAVPRHEDEGVVGVGVGKEGVDRVERAGGRRLTD